MRVCPIRSEVYQKSRHAYAIRRRDRIFDRVIIDAFDSETPSISATTVRPNAHNPSQPLGEFLLCASQIKFQLVVAGASERVSAIWPVEPFFSYAKRAQIYLAAPRRMTAECDMHRKADVIATVESKGIELTEELIFSRLGLVRRSTQSDRPINSRGL